MVRLPAAGYACGVAGLGVTASATPDDVRAAFLQLTKHFHPVRFGRMAGDIQKQANEVFLALRAAHDSVARTLRRPAPTPPPGLPVAATASGPANGRGQALPARAARLPPH